MRRYLWVLAFAAAVCLLPNGTFAATAEDAAKPYAGQILIDAANHGEAWYVNPQSLMRVYLGRPSEALDRLTARAVYVSFGNIARVAVEGQGTSDAAYAADRAGYVLAPDDMLGAGWYVHPTLKVRMRLATADDAWLVMRTGVPVPAKALAAIAIESETAKPSISGHRIKEVVSADTVVLDDDTKIRLISVDVPTNPELQQAAMDRIKTLTTGKTVMVESDIKDQTADGSKLRFLQVGDVNLNYDLVRNGLAFHNLEFPNWKYAELLLVGGLDAMNQKKGMWNR
ncbi:MAG: thermonuclease family protein [Patescibacteria group bacterium]|jgi:endonuclease YncB( thermonuclease family)